MLCFVIVISMFLFCDDVLAEEYGDHSMIYSVEDFSVDNSSNTLNLSGWAFVHNVSQCGGGICANSSGNYQVGTTGAINLGTVSTGLTYMVPDLSSLAPELSRVYESKIILTLEQKNGIKYSNDCQGDATCVEGVVNLSYTNIDLFSWMCSVHGAGSCTGFIIDNVGFNASIDLDQVSYGDYTLKIRVSLKGYTGVIHGNDKSVAVSSSIYSNSGEVLANGAKITVDSLTNTVTNRNNPQIAQLMSFDSSNRLISNPYVYFSGTTDYIVASSIAPNQYQIRSIYGTDKVHTYYPRLFGVYTGTPSTNTSACNPSGSSCNIYYGPATWFQTKGETLITIESNDKYCDPVNDANINSCDGTPLSYSCPAMTVKSSGVSADVKLTESATLYGVDSTADRNYIFYPDITVYAGGFLNFSFIYQDTLTWEYVDNINEYTSAEREAIARAVYQYYKPLNSNNLLNLIGVNDTENSPNSPMANAGKWECSVDDDFDNPNGGTVTTTCYYNLNDAYIKDGQVTYVSKANGYQKAGEGVFYIYRTYPLDQYKWNIRSKDGVSVSTLKVQVDADNTKQIDFIIDTSTNSDNSCYFNVKNDAFEYPPDSDGGNGGGNGDASLKFIYRSIDESDPFPKISSYLDYPQNWKDYYLSVGSLDRIENSFSMDIDYQTRLLTRELIRELNDYDKTYTYDDVDASGNVSSIVNGEFFEIYNAKHSKKGYYDEGSDKG